MNQVAYKILRVENNLLTRRLYSFIGKDMGGIEYFKTKINRPKIPNSKLFVFNTLDDAIKLMDNTSSYEIWTCECENLAAPYKIMNFSFVYNHAYEFWNNINMSKFKDRCEMDFSCKDWDRFVPLMNAPEGTLVCDSLKLIEKVV